VGVWEAMMGDGDWSQGGGVRKVLCGMAFEFDFFGILKIGEDGCDVSGPTIISILCGEYPGTHV